MLLVVIQWGRLALQALQVLQEQLDHLEQLDLQEQLANQVHQVHQVHQEPLSNKIFRKNWLMDLNPSAN